MFPFVLGILQTTPLKALMFSGHNKMLQIPMSMVDMYTFLRKTLWCFAGRSCMEITWPVEDGLKICRWPADDHHGHVVVPLLCSICPNGFALPLVCSLPTASWFMVGPCVQVSVIILH